jgi:RNA polymerase sigma-70 factor (ECF subfamily)
MSHDAVFSGERPSKDDEIGWVLRAAQGDATAFRRIVEQHHRSLFSMATRLVGDAVEAQDLVQESFAKAYVNLERFDSSFRLSTWLHRITLNTCRDYLKSARRRERSSGSDPSADRPNEAPGPDEELSRARRAERVWRALDRLKASYREAIVLKDLEDMSYEEIRAITGTPITALKIRVVRARAKLRAFLEEET